MSALFRLLGLCVTPRSLVALGACVLTCAVLAASTARAQAVRIDFENIKTGARGSGGQVRIARQYAQQGLILNDAILLDYSTSRTPSFAHSGTRAIEHCYAIEFCETPFELSFTSAQSRVKVWAGYYGGLRGPATVRLEALDRAGKLLRATQAKLDARNAAPIQTPLEVKFDEPLIWRAKVSITGAPISGFALDDIEFDAVALRPDLILQGATHRADGDQHFIDARVENVGQRASGPTVFEIASEGHTARADVPSLAPKQSVPIAVTVGWTLGAGSHAFALAVDPDRRIPEEHDDNNGSSLTITVAPKPVAVPNVIGISLENARATIDRAGLASGGQFEGLDAVKAIVRSQTPSAGTLALPGSTVTLEASIPAPVTVAVPNVIGSSVQDARAAIEGVRLAVGGELAGLDPAKATVRNQSPAAGTLVAAGTVVTLDAAVRDRFPWWVVAPIAGLLGGVAAYMLLKPNPSPPLPPTFAVEGSMQGGSAEIEFATPTATLPRVTFRFEAGPAAHEIVEPIVKGEAPR